MTRREILAAATAAPLAALARPAEAHDQHQYPTMQQLIALAESSPAEADRIYYGRVLAVALSETGRVANDNGDDTVALYEAEMVRDQGGVQSWAWSKNTVRGSLRPVPDNILPRFRPAQRGQFFPANVRYLPLS
jgi:hypothetical protein